MRLICALLALAAATAYPDTVNLRNGTVLDGTFLGATPRQIRMEVGGRVETIEISDVASVVFGAPAQAPPAAQNYQPQQPAYPAPAPAAQSYAAPAAMQGMELPAGTTFRVRMIDSVDSDRNRVGDSFRGSLDDPVYLNGQQIMPRGSDVVLRLVDSKESGKLAGRSSLTLSLQSIQAGGRMVDINTQSVTTESSSRGARTAKMGLGGAGVGAAIGAIAGGGKGAAIGAGAGGAAGVGAEVLTKGQRVRIPSETRLTFRLDIGVRI